MHKKSIQVRLFSEALKNENSGHFAEAITRYETVLNEVKKNRFRGNSFKNKIIEKLKVLHTITEYKNNLCFIR